MSISGQLKKVAGVDADMRHRILDAVKDIAYSGTEVVSLLRITAFKRRFDVGGDFHAANAFLEYFEEEWVKCHRR